jgi:ABC-2 type transport system permease protein
MIEDIWTVMWKEFKEILPQRGEMRIGAFSRFIVPIFLLGMFLPWQFGNEWIQSPVTLLSWAWLPAFLVISLVADAFAGERERHTLETLLASRLSDETILFGKIGASVGYGLGLTLISMLVGLVTINLVYRTDGLLLYSADAALIAIASGFLIALMVTSVGALISLHAPTVRQAQQTLSISFMILWFGAIFGVQALPVEWTTNMMQFLMTVGEINLILTAMALLVTVDIGLMLIAIARFKRARLILD